MKVIKNNFNNSRKFLIFWGIIFIAFIIYYIFLRNKQKIFIESLQIISSIHAFKVNGNDGKTIVFASFKGKKILVVNTASKDGYTPQYEGLQKLYTQYINKLVIVGFPCNQFGGQEPGNNAEILNFVEKTYGVTFPMADKIDVKGPGIAPIYQWLTQKSKNGVLDATIKWNFYKFLLDEEGKMLAFFPNSVKPDSDDILKYLK